MGIWGGNGGTISIENFNNQGTIKSDIYNAAGFFEGNTHITTFKNTGTINGGNNQGIFFKGTRVKTFENTGTISGIIGVMTTGGTIETFKNSGIIESTSREAIKIYAFSNNPSTITRFTNEGTIKSASDGVWIESNNKIETLTNKGTIESKSNGISFFDFGPGTNPDKAELGKIVLESGSSIKAGKNGINIDNQTAKTITTNGIEVQKGASVSGDEAGIYLGKGKEITAPITVSGTVSGGNAGIVNEGKMAKGITHDGEGDLVILSRGLVGKDEQGNTVTNNSGSVTIKDWVVSTNEEGKLDTVVIGGKKTDDVKVNSITVDQSGLDINQLNDITNIISGVSTNNIADSVKTNGGGEISLSFDPLSGRLSTDVQLNASIAGASFRSSLAT
ncbi:autotransporter outer membrane beta-barrel domain-containing protein, partial [Campylobacter jejuni]|nr:autotransporter outer membrane beta-barrel domain-containing protein [Campylobacter jejuni]